MPGDNVEMVCSLVFDVALEVGTRYAVIESIYKRHAAHAILQIHPSRS